LIFIVPPYADKPKPSSFVHEGHEGHEGYWFFGYDLRFGRPPFVSHQKWHGWNCQVDIIPHGCCPVAETKINAGFSFVTSLALAGTQVPGSCSSWKNFLAQCTKI
jgi:hypothetical protein